MDRRDEFSIEELASRLDPEGPDFEPGHRAQPWQGSRRRGRTGL